MAKVLVLYYSSWGHMEAMAWSAVEGVGQAGAEAVTKRVPELVPKEVAEKSGYKLDQQAEVADPSELDRYDGFVFGVPTRFGNMPAQMKNFLDQTGAHWMNKTLIDKPATVMCSTASQHGGQETTLITTQVVLQHQGLLIVPLSYAYEGQNGNDVIRGGSPYGMSVSTNSDGSRWPNEANGAS